MRKLLIIVSALILVLGAMMLLARTRRGEWTTDSPSALAEFEKGREARMRYYAREARKHYRKALEHDPDFVAAKWALLRASGDPEEVLRLASELQAADLGRLTAREQFLVRYQLTRFEDRSKEARQILKSFLDVYPNDPYGLSETADLYWAEQKWDKASEFYRRLLAADPNWVVAQNRLAYLAMAQGQFDEAEELLGIYQYIAPDQANPYDSMGELMMILGRYEEARDAFEKALEIKPDFCSTHRHLQELLSLEGRHDEAEPLLERAVAARCGGQWIESRRCVNRFWSDYADGDYDAPWREERAACKALLGPFWMIHRMASLTGRTDEALAIEEALVEDFHYDAPEDVASVRMIKGQLLHLQGVRLLAEGDAPEAAERLAHADEKLYYWGQDQAILKLFNRLNLACAYELAGDQQRARKMVGQVAEVNPAFAGFYGYLLESFS